MSHPQHHLSREEEEYYYNLNQRSPPPPQPAYYDTSQGNPYAYYSPPQPQASPDYHRNGSYREQAVVRNGNSNRDRERYCSDSDDSYSDDSRHQHRHKPRSRSKKARSKSRDHNKDEPATKLDNVKDGVKKHFGASDQNYVASVVGMIAGGLLGGEAVKGGKAPLGVIGGALLGGLSANAIEKKREQIKEQREEEEARYRRRKSER